MEKYGAGAIVVSAYDPNWPALFDEERARIQAALGSLALAVEHIGSTAVPGLPSKPIIDLLVGVPDLDGAQHRYVEPMATLGYIYMPQYESWLPGELFFRKGPPGPWTHHVHVMPLSHPRWQQLILFRDYLRAHPEAARAYADVKRELACTSRDDIAAYRNGKSAFVEATTAPGAGLGRRARPVILRSHVVARPLK
ncbi:GrpB family protein [Bradyrhizobium septentrionale]|uniref:GrpB family protein n=1 Tax=Bradyrhizobium septentrionale TaxID=1404411 RepID=A0A974A144_9BRAD|nr:GrpB family protein [Bradyrhizobium septentrionale]UGY14673.1 GrpB family protein [Bradyrhizobium septentrionale]UGY23247.1 GrpB family protein [Bradyrhizobium septentrionale]